jgi:hypothetical protein
MDQKRSDFDFDFHHDAADMEYGYSMSPATIAQAID